MTNNDNFASSYITSEFSSKRSKKLVLEAPIKLYSETKNGQCKVKRSKE